MTKANPKPSKPSKVAKKSATRLTAVQIVYEHLMRESVLKDILSDYKQNRLKFPLDEGETLIQPDMMFLVKIVQGVEEHKESLSQMILSKIKKDNKRLDSLLSAILFCGTYEIFALGDIDTGIIISDYMHVTEAFFEGSEPKLINAILDKIAKDIRG